MLNESDAVNRSTANGVTTVFPYTFKIYDESEIEVLANETVLTLGIHYTVSGVGADGGGSITTISTYANGTIITRIRKQPTAQTSNYQSEAFPPERIERDFDKLAMRLQQVKEMLRRCLLFAKSSSTVDQTIDTPSVGLFARAKSGGGIDWATPAAVNASLPLAVTDGGTGATSATGTGSVVRQDNPTINTPTITGLSLSSVASVSMTGGINESLSTVASSATPNIFSSAVGNTVNYTGTTPATGFTAAPQAGTQRVLVCAAAAPFVASANMLIDGVSIGGTYTASAGDKVLVIAVTTTQFRLTPMKYDGRAMVASTLQNVVLDNGRITVVMSGNAVTIALKDLNGNDLTTTNPAYITFRSGTSTSSQLVTRSITSALSTVISSGSTAGTLNNVASRIYVGVIDNAGAVELCWWNPVLGSSLYAPSESSYISTTSEGGAGGADSAHVIYSTTARTNVALRVIAYFESTQATAGTWASSASAIQMMGPGVKRTLNVVQVKRSEDGAFASGTVILPKDNTIPQNTEGDQYLSVSITPTSTVNQLMVTAKTHFSHSSDGRITKALFQDASANALRSSYITSQGSNVLSAMMLRHQMSAGTTSTTTFKIRAGSAGAGTTYFNGESGAGLFNGTLDSFIEVQEIFA